MLGDQQITVLDYADDIAVLSESEHDLQVFVDKVIFFGNLVALKINPDKSKVMSFCSLPPRIIINGLQLESVEQFRYLGSLISANTSCEKDVLSRIGFAQASFQRLFTALFSREDISINTKMHVYLALIRTVLLYGCKSWNITAALASTLDSCEMTFFTQDIGCFK